MKLPPNESYPKKIYFQNGYYSVKFRKNFRYAGLTDANTKTITLCDGMSRRATFSTLIHELLHLIEFEYPVKLKHKTIYKLEQAITEIMLDNFL